MKALKYLDELIEFEESYQTGYISQGEKIPNDSVKRLKELREARSEVFALSNVVGRSEQLVCESCKQKFTPIDKWNFHCQECQPCKPLEAN